MWFYLNMEYNIKWVFLYLEVTMWRISNKLTTTYPVPFGDPIYSIDFWNAFEAAFLFTASYSAKTVSSLLACSASVDC